MYSVLSYNNTWYTRQSLREAPLTVSMLNKCICCKFSNLEHNAGRTAYCFNVEQLAQPCNMSHIILCCTSSLVSKPPPEHTIFGRSWPRSLPAGLPNYTMIYYTILCYTILYYTILYYTILYYIPLSSIRSVFKTSCLFLRPRPWQFEI